MEAEFQKTQTPLRAFNRRDDIATKSRCIWTTTDEVARRKD